MAPKRISRNLATITKMNTKNKEIATEKILKKKSMAKGKILRSYAKKTKKSTINKKT
jgi:hypothetical protein